MSFICPLTYQKLDTVGYSIEGQRQIHSKLTNLQNLDWEYSSLEMLTKYAEGWSLPGDTKKAPVLFDSSISSFVPSELPLKYFLKYETGIHLMLPNEDLTIKIANLLGIETVNQGLIFDQEMKLSMWVQRFDTKVKGGRKYLENFSQLSGYQSGAESPLMVELGVKLIKQHCTFPRVEMERYFRRLLLAHLCGFNRIHFGKFSLVEDENHVVKLSPLYGFRNTMIYENLFPVGNDWIINRKSSDWNRADYFEFLAEEKLSLSKKSIDKIQNQIRNQIEAINDLIERSFLSKELKKKYQNVFSLRSRALGF